MVDQELRKQMVQMANDARRNAYAPFSKFRVGAALLAKSGAIYCGVNVENSSYGLTCCAERTAIFSAIAAGHVRNAFVAMAISSPGGASPCGACRQVIYELAEDATLLLVDADHNKPVAEVTIGELLPTSFRLEVDE